MLMFVVQIASALTIKDVISTPSEFAPGETGKVELEIENELEEDTEDVVVSLDLTATPFAPYQSGADASIEDGVSKGDKETVSFNLIALADAEAGIYRIPVLITYTLDINGSLPETRATFMSLTINSPPTLQLSYEGILIKGKKNKLDIRITNKGLTEAKLLNVNLADIDGLEFLSAKEIYVGDIESDDFDSVDFSVFVEGRADSLVNLPITLTYRDALNKLIEEEINVVLKTYTEEEAIALGLRTKSKAMLYTIVVVILIVVWIIYRQIKKRRRNKKKKK